jgi:hypothetical protein
LDREDERSHSVIVTASGKRGRQNTFGFDTSRATGA